MAGGQQFDHHYVRLQRKVVRRLADAAPTPDTIAAAVARAADRADDADVPPERIVSAVGFADARAWYGDL